MFAYPEWVVIGYNFDFGPAYPAVQFDFVESVCLVCYLTIVSVTFENHNFFHFAVGLHIEDFGRLFQAVTLLPLSLPVTEMQFKHPYPTGFAQ